MKNKALHSKNIKLYWNLAPISMHFWHVRVCVWLFVGVRGHVAELNSLLESTEKGL